VNARCRWRRTQQNRIKRRRRRRFVGFARLTSVAALSALRSAPPRLLFK